MASGRAIDVSDRKLLVAYRRRMSTTVWQDPAWVYNGQVPIVGFCHDYVRDSIARVRPYPAILSDDPDEPPIPIKQDTAPAGLSADLCDQIVQRLQPFPDYMGGNAHKIDISGEAYTALLKDPDSPTGERCQVFSHRELVAYGDEWRWRDDPQDSVGQLLEPGTPFWRLWTPDPEFSSLPFSHMVRLNLACEQLLLLNRLIKAVALSRLATTGKIIAIADEFELEMATEDGQASTEDAGDGETLGSNFFDDFVASGATAMLDPESAAAVMNLVIRGPKELIKDGINVIDISRTMEDVLIKLRQEAREEIATGVNLPREIPLGVGSTNHWNAEEIRTQAWQIHLEPRALAICAGTTTAFLRPSLLANKVDPDIVKRVLMWYDPTWFLGAPDLSEHADEALAHYAISLDAYRRSRGYSPDDAPTDEEIQMRIGWVQQGQVRTTIRQEEQGGTEPTVVDPSEEGAKPTPGGAPAVPAPKPQADGGSKTAKVPDTPDMTAPPDGKSAEAPAGGKKPPGKKKALTAAAGPQTGVMVALMVPADEAAQLAELMDNRMDPSEMHVTVAFLGDVNDMTDDQQAQLGDIVSRVAATSEPVTGATVPGTDEFGDGNDERAVVTKPYIPNVYSVHHQIVSAAEQAGLPVRTDYAYDNYQPHITLGYLEPDEDSPDVQVPTMPLHFPALTLRMGDQEAQYPFGAGVTDALVAASRDMRRRRHADLGNRHVAIERDLRLSLLRIADSTIAQALERAGMRVKSKAGRARGTTAAAGVSRTAFSTMMEGRSPAEIPSILGEQAVHALGLNEHLLLQGALGEFEHRYKLLVKRAQHAAAHAAALSDGGDGDYDEDALDEATQPDRDASWLLLAAGLTGLATALLYNPHPAAPDVGEFDDTALVPPGLIRAALARAGGAAEGPAVQVRGADIPQPTTALQGDTLPAGIGGATAGPTMLDQFEQQLGISADGYTWVYGDAPRKEFKPHSDLDGTTFSSWDDDVLENTGDWPDYDHLFPGDHNGCLCDAAITYTQAGEDTTLEPGLGVDYPDGLTRTEEADAMDAPRRERGAAHGREFAFDFDEGLHPRGPGGKFAPKDDADHETVRSARARTGTLPGTRGNPIPCGKDIDKAATLISQGKAVSLNQPEQVSTLLDKLAEIAQDAKDRGEKAPNYDLCNVSVPGTNLFCNDTLGVPRVEMPQFSGTPAEDSPAALLPRDSRGEVNASEQFVNSLKASGIGVTQETVPAANLRASQSELVGTKVAGMMQAIEAGTLPPGSIFVTRDNYVLDGHHRWAAQIGVDAADGHLGDVRMDVQKIDMDIGAAISYANDWATQYGIKPKGATASGRSLLTFGDVVSVWGMDQAGVLAAADAVVGHGSLDGSISASSVASAISLVDAVADPTSVGHVETADALYRLVPDPSGELARMFVESTTVMFALAPFDRSDRRILTPAQSAQLLLVTAGPVHGARVNGDVVLGGRFKVEGAVRTGERTTVTLSQVAVPTR